ncbi:MAG: alpha/beta hydrolase [Sphingomonadales bacterium]|jgi:pimeloyl-ACP methyl ester carboxylesterase
MTQEIHYLNLGNGEKLAFHHSHGKGPGVVFLGGFMSDMTGTKATALESHVQACGHGFTRFDYSGHGASDGAFRDGTIGRWKDDALAVLDEVAEGPQILIGSSMGGWIALLCALARPEKVKGLILIAPAPDFTERLMWPDFSDEEKALIQSQGYIEQPSDYGDEPYVITKALIEDGRDHLLLDKLIALDIPVRILHGMKDVDVPYQLSFDLIEALTSTDVVLTLVKEGDHRLSEEDDIMRLNTTVDALLSGLS